MIIKRITPDPDSHYRLRVCPCGGTAEYLGFDTGMWAVRCTHCGRAGSPQAARHTAQVAWNRGGADA